MDPRLRIRIRIKISWIHNTGFEAAGRQVHISANWRIFYVDLARKILGNVVIATAYSPSPCPVGSRGGRESSRRRQGSDTTRDTSTLTISSWNMSCTGEKPKVLRVRDILVRIRIFGSVAVTNGSADADTDTDPDAAPDPAVFVIDLQDVNKKLIKESFFAYYFLKVHLRHSSKIKSKKEVTKQ
jgi:hypothetical protein